MKRKGNAKGKKSKGFRTRSGAGKASQAGMKEAPEEKQNRERSQG